MPARHVVSHSIADIRRQAVRLLQSAGISREPVALRDVVSALNLQVVQASGQPFFCEAALQTVGDGRQIVVRGASSEQRRRFTIAHEIGHFVLHPRRLAPERGGDPGNASWQQQEREADQFAAELLMPEDLVREAFYLYGPDVPRLAGRFDVSRQAMQTRLRSLGLAGHHDEVGVRPVR
jgi:Zn-dependent peptidase ImmA (M78 family)